MNGSEKTSKYRKYVPKYGVKNSDNRTTAQNTVITRM